jgi:hypothetical protein
MAARRLVLVMLVLLLVSTLLAALVPAGDPPGDETTTQPTTAAPEPPGERVARTIDAGADRPARIPIALGDQLSLTVRSQRTDQVEIPGLGELEDVDPEAPARFDVLPAQPGSYAVRIPGSDRPIARIEVEPRRDDLSGSRRRSGRSAGTSRSR